MPFITFVLFIDLCPSLYFKTNFLVLLYFSLWMLQGGIFFQKRLNSY